MQIRRQAYQLIALQILIVIFVALCWLFRSYIAAESALLGGLAYILPNFYFVRRFFTTIYASQVKKIIKNFYWGEVIKLSLMGLIVVLVTAFWRIELMAFFSGFIVAQFGFWLLPLIGNQK